ncbi:hypothetical protein FOZ63_004783 [Perkinsus olseni]|uniref:Uncharacterized protein n=1 Tax=Perkinsus olseni TaxID=32597 RepID=A0A7J6RT08_PEROL|nr:hypothetical protein FOZ63_004783 [Perkinsus olseni]
MNFISTWLIYAQLLVITTTQDVGKFVHREAFFNITYDVNEEGQIMISFTSMAPPPPGSPAGTPPDFQGNYFGYYSLSRVRGPLTLDRGHTYAVGPDADVGSWYGSFAHQLRRADAERAHEPLAGIQTGDLTTLTYTSGDSFTTEFRNETIEFMRVAHSFTPGVFGYAESVAPYFKLTYLIRADGIVGIQASCNRRRTSQVPFHLSRRDKGRPYLYYELESAGRGTLDQLLDMVNIVCPRTYLLHDDLSQVVFATSNTIYVTLGGARMILTRTK